jgi:hypothetical protein
LDGYRDDLKAYRILVVPGPPVCSLALPWHFLDWKWHLRTRARDLWEKAIKQQEVAVAGDRDYLAYRRDLAGHHWGAANVSVQLGDHVRAAQAARELYDQGRQLPKPPPEENKKSYQVQAARFLTRCVPLVKNDAKLAQSYANDAEKMFRQAVADGHVSDDELNKDPDFEALRGFSRDGFGKPLPEPKLKED